MSSDTGVEMSSTNTVIGLTLAISSGLLIGTSFIFKKLGLRKTQGNGPYGYLSSRFWWVGMIMMALGEIANFSAYAFTPALLVTPLGALSVVVTAVLSTMFLNESLTIHGKIGCFLCIVGSVIIVFHAPQEMAHSSIPDFQQYALEPGFLTWASFLIIVSAGLAIRMAPKHGDSSMMVYIAICSLVGSLSVVATQGIGAAIVHSVTQPDDSQIGYWFFWVLLVFMICTLLVEVNFLNQALRLFNTAIVTPIYFVCFTTSTIASTAIFAKGYNAPPVSMMTGVCGFLVICSGVMLLQLSKPKQEESDKGREEETSVPGCLELRSNPLQLIHDASMYHSRQHSATSSVLPQHHIHRHRSPDSILREERETDGSTNTLAEVTGSSEECQVDPTETKKLTLTSLGHNIRVKRAVNLRTGETTEVIEEVINRRNSSPNIQGRRFSNFSSRFVPNNPPSPNTQSRYLPSGVPSSTGFPNHEATGAGHIDNPNSLRPSPVPPALVLSLGNSPISVPSNAVLDEIFGQRNSSPNVQGRRLSNFSSRFVPNMPPSPNSQSRNLPSGFPNHETSGVVPVDDLNLIQPSPAPPTLVLPSGDSPISVPPCFETSGRNSPMSELPSLETDSTSSGRNSPMSDLPSLETDSTSSGRRSPMSEPPSLNASGRSSPMS